MDRLGTVVVGLTLLACSQISSVGECSCRAMRPSLATCMHSPNCSFAHSRGGRQGGGPDRLAGRELGRYERPGGHARHACKVHPDGTRRCPLLLNSPPAPRPRRRLRHQRLGVIAERMHGEGMWDEGLLSTQLSRTHNSSCLPLCAGLRPFPGRRGVRNAACVHKACVGIPGDSCSPASLTHAAAFVYHGFLTHAECDHLTTIGDQRVSWHLSPLQGDRHTRREKRFWILDPLPTPICRCTAR
jgi:hypothetical protein